jgi:putrescine importer
MIGWATLLDYFFIPMVIWLIGATYLSAAFPRLPVWIWIVAFIVLTSTVNIIGIQLAARPGGLALAEPFFKSHAPFFVVVFLAGLILAQFASGISAQASVGRLLYAMGRDRVLPPRIFGFIHPRFQTPALNIGLAGIVGLIALALADLSLLVSLDRAALILGTAWFLAGLAYLAWITRCFRQPPPSVPV